MDAAALSLCRENNLPILVFDIRDDGAIERAVDGDRSARWSPRANRASPPPEPSPSRGCG